MRLFPRNRQLGLGSILAALFAAGGCDTGPTKILVAPSTFIPSPSAVVFVQPSVIALTPTVTPSCVGFVPVDGLDLVVRQPPTNVTLSAVTIQMIDGTHLGGSPVTIPQPRLTSLFPSTLIVAGTVGVFSFSPIIFGCVTTLPTSVVVNATLTDQSGNSQQVSTTVSVRQ